MPRIKAPFIRDGATRDKQTLLVSLVKETTFFVVAESHTGDTATTKDDL